MDLVHAFNDSSPFAQLSLLVGIGPAALAIAYLFRPADRTLALMRPVSLAAVFAAFCGLVAGLITILMGIGATLPHPVHVPKVYFGLAEALLPPFFNCGLLATSWLLVAIGMMRRARLE